MTLTEALSKFWPLLILQLGLMAVALNDILRRREFRLLSKAAWIGVVILIQTLGPIAYFLFGRGEE